MGLSSELGSTLNLISRIGWVCEIHPEGNRLKLDFEDNPYGQPIWGAIGRSFSRAEIHAAIDNQLDCRIDFLAGDIDLPILRDIYFSLLSDQEITLKAKRVVLEGDESVLIQSGKAQTLHQARSGRVTTSAEQISNSAEKMVKIQGQRINLN